MKKLKIVTALLITTLSLSAKTITGEGYGTLEKDAKDEALTDLSKNIYVDVKSNFKTIIKLFNNDYQKSKEKISDISSDLPIIGASYHKIIGDRLVKSIATISSSGSLQLYKSELFRLNQNIFKSMQEYKKAKNSDIKYNILNNTLKDIENFNKHKIVAILLGAKHLPILTTTKSQILAELQKYSQDIPTIKIASKILTDDITQENIYLSSIKANGSNQVTQFAKVIKSEMGKYLNTTRYSSDANYYIKGSYEILSNSIFISVHLYDKSNKIIKTNTATLKPSAYKHTNYKPSIKTFDYAMNTGFIKSGNLSVNIGFKGYNRDNGIDLDENDEIDIIVKTNKPICYFLMGHTLHKNSKFSYILPIQGNIINYITGEDVNRYIPIEENIPISKPFGSENLQIFASTMKNNRCPLKVPNSYKDNDGYFVVGTKPSKVVQNTRALNISKRKNKIEKAEASISWTSFGDNGKIKK
ncbi:MAG: hypothetical protein U9Q30_09980 [Campylobacterota bacterium]|nr:hypothetical protein [Campylobacterota bacterium]